jgi:Uma2 family endonuclease
MNVVTKPRMTVDEFLTWAAGRRGRHELVNGEVIPMAPETVAHLEAKIAIFDALRAAVRGRGIDCHVLPDGATVRVDSVTAFEPDALVYSGQRLPPSAIEIPNPVIVVEVLSPSTQRIDSTLKLAGYFRLPSVFHYLIADPGQRSVVHHARGPNGTIVTKIITEGSIVLDPPGLKLALGDLYE